MKARPEGLAGISTVTRVTVAQYVRLGANGALDRFDERRS